MLNSLDLSIIIVNWNTAEITSDCLSSIFENIKNISFEVIVIDNNSSDESVSLFKTKFPQVKLIENKTNSGFAAANNQGINISCSKYVLLLNSDTLLIDNSIENLIQTFHSNENISVIGCLVLNKNMTIQPSCSMFPSLINKLIMITGLYKALPENKFFGRAQMTWFNYDRIMEVDVVSGCFMLINKKAIQEVGLMDEGYFMYSEEVDWCYRFKKAGWKIFFNPAAKIIHLGGASAAKLGSQRAKIKDASTIKYMFKHWSKTKAFFGLLLMALFYFTRLPFVLFCYIIKRDSASKAKLANHTSGLISLFNFKRY